MTPPLTPKQLRAIHAQGDTNESRPKYVPSSQANAATHKGFTLYSRDVVLKNGNGHQRIYFFSKHKPVSGAPAALPPGYRIDETSSGLPFVKKA